MALQGETNFVARAVFKLLPMLFYAPVLVVADSPAQPAALPNPLTLIQAIEIAETGHPDLELAASRLQKTRAQLDTARAEKGFALSLNATAQTVDPVSSSGYEDDSQASLLLRKRLFDFGKTGNSIASARAALEGEWQRYFDSRQRQRLDVMKLFYDVLLADLRYQVDNETMARVYVQYDRIRQRHELGQISDVELLGHESRYRSALSQRVHAQAQQRASRARLAIGMNRPDELADDLTPPVLDDLERKLPEYDEVVKKVLAVNPVLLARKQDVLSAEKLVRSARAVARPELDMELEANQFQRPLGLRNDSRAGIVLRWPIYRGGIRNARLGEADARLREARAKFRKTEMQLKQKTLDTLQRIEVLQYQRQEAKTLMAYRDLQLDQRRALYEMEVSTTLGDAMIGVTESQWKAAQTNYALALAWAELKALTGELVEETAEEKYR